jgi:NADPH:quinone reductase
MSYAIAPVFEFSYAACIPFLTAYQSLVEAMNVKSGQTLLVRGGTSSVGMAAISIPEQLGITTVVATTLQQKGL